MGTILIHFTTFCFLVILAPLVFLGRSDASFSFGNSITQRHSTIEDISGFITFSNTLSKTTKPSPSVLSRSTFSSPLKMSSSKKISTVETQPPRPNSCTYWVTESFMAGEYPTAASSDEARTRDKLRQYLKSGITYFVDLTQPGEKPNYEAILKDEAKQLNIQKEVTYRRFAIPDFGITNTDTMTNILNTIDDAIQDGHKVYAHCRGGIGRTGTTVGCYLVRHGNTGQEALTEVNRLFQTSYRSMESSSSPETRDQMQFVKDWRG